LLRHEPFAVRIVATHNLSINKGVGA